ncbi:MAG: methylated-DNA--[Bacteroidaceae bacterium]|nr:methylated-DNA--[protein]-cysteine S-methyltransferase [Bacteroidaceae bacterium]
MEEKIYIETPIGTLQVTMQCGQVCGISMMHEGSCRTITQTPFQEKIKNEIEEYFAGQRKEFTFPLKMKGSSFQLRVWEALRRIPYGSIATYGDIARRIGFPKASRAVGMACNRNPILLAVPCHRVVGTGGKLTGFAVGIERKEYLLRLERILL